MSNNLILNPFLEIHIDSEEETDFLLLAPKKNVGLQILRVSSSKEATLHKLITDYSKIGFNYIDVNEDLDADAFQLFKENAIIINEKEKSEKPLFSCQLNDVITLVEAFTDDLIVNPTFRFEPMNLATFKEWIYQKHISPQQATVWIKNPVTKIEFGYWLDANETEIISTFQSGQTLPAKIDGKLLAKLLSAKIIVSKKQYEKDFDYWKDILENARTQFSENRYIVIEQLLPKSQMQAMQLFYKDYISQGFMEFGDEFVNRRFRQHNEPFARLMQSNFAKLMSEVVGQEIIPSYCYAASYKEFAELKPHTDREQCEFSISFQVDYEPPQTNEISPWELSLATPKTLFKEKVKFEWDEFFNDPDLSSKTSSISLKNGDGLFYKGRDLIHYRTPLPQNHKSTSLFFHYVPKDFAGDLR